MIRVTTGSRLHFGLLSLPPAEHWPETYPNTNIASRYFGGIGMMVEEPCVTVQCQPADEWSYYGPNSDRVREFAQHVTATPHQVSIRSCPPQHVGLGVGTQLCLAAGTALTGGRTPPGELAQRLGRGNRSGIGIHGFAKGGFIVDAGKARPDSPATIVACDPVPESWHILLITPRIESPYYGERERSALAELAGQCQRDDVMARLVVTSILPALLQFDLTNFGAALTEYNARAGDKFRSIQGGRYSHESIKTLVEELLRLGFAGAGQTSWGPTVFGLTDDFERADHVRKNLIMPVEAKIVVTRAQGRLHIDREMITAFG